MGKIFLTRNRFDSPTGMKTEVSRVNMKKNNVQIQLGENFLSKIFSLNCLINVSFGSLEIYMFFFIIKALVLHDGNGAIFPLLAFPLMFLIMNVFVHFLLIFTQESVENRMVINGSLCQYVCGWTSYGHAHATVRVFKDNEKRWLYGLIRCKVRNQIWQSSGKRSVRYESAEKYFPDQIRSWYREVIAEYEELSVSWNKEI